MEEPGRLHDATLVRITQPDRTGGVALPVAREKGRDLRLWCEFFRLAFPSRVRDVCGPRGSSEYTQRAGVLGGARQLQSCDPGDHAGNSLPNALRLHSAKDFRTKCGEDSPSGIEPLRGPPVHTWHHDQKMTNLGADPNGNASRSCWTIHKLVGRLVILKCRIRRRS
jgi:hypothetical protein